MGMCKSEAMLRVVGAVAVAAAGLAVPGAGATSVPILRVVDPSPLVIVGYGFEAGQRVHVTVRMPGRAELRTPRADARGRFRVVITSIRLTGKRRCAVGVVIAARTDDGKFVLWHPQRLPDCASPLRPPS